MRGEPAYSANKPQDALREAFAALQIARKRAAAGARQQVYIGDAAVEMLYGRPNKRLEEKDCDVVGYVLQGSSYGYFLGGRRITKKKKAKEQFDAAANLLRARKTDPGPILGAVVVTARLRSFEWSALRKQWVAYVDTAEERHITARLQQNVANAKPTLQQDRIYLLDGPEENGLPTWNIVARGSQPFTVYIHDRHAGSTRGTFRPLILGSGTVEIHYVA
ncbi:MAG: hypothetical protein JO097_00065 [Acidobacteriaceae bacterium]|nr:hypothetical protein [Acidobacteriaceae bacterium]